MYLNAKDNQDVVNQVNKEIGNVRKGQRVKEYFDTAVARYGVLQSQNNANDGNNRSISDRRGNVRLSNRLLQTGRYFDRPDLYVKTQRTDKFGFIEDNTSFRIVTDKATLDRLNSVPTINLYRNVLYNPNINYI